MVKLPEPLKVPDEVSSLHSRSPLILPDPDILNDLFNLPPEIFADPVALICSSYSTKSPVLVIIALLTSSSIDSLFFFSLVRFT